MTTLGERLKIARKKTKLSQRAVVEELNKRGIDITQATLSRYETNEFDTPASVIRALSKLYNTDAKCLLFDESEL